MRPVRARACVCIHGYRHSCHHHQLMSPTSVLTALIQLMAAAVAERDVCYFTYKDNKLTQDIYDIHKLITDRRLTVGTCFVSVASDNYVGIWSFIKK